MISSPILLEGGISTAQGKGLLLAMVQRLSPWGNMAVSPDGTLVTVLDWPRSAVPGQSKYRSCRASECNWDLVPPAASTASESPPGVLALPVFMKAGSALLKLPGCNQNKVPIVSGRISVVLNSAPGLEPAMREICKA